MITPVTHFLPLAKIRRQRFLPVAGTVLVRAGQDVKAEDVIAQADINPEHISLEIERGLGVSKGDITGYMKRKIGDEIPEGSVVASRSGVVSRVVRAPRAGKLVAIGGGQVLLQVRNDPFELKAGMPGSVIEVKVDFGAIIQATGAWIQGVWGNGRLKTGLLLALAEEPNHVLTADQVDSGQRGAIILAGHCGEQSALEALAEAHIGGLILGSMSTRLLPFAARMHYPIIVIEGFGHIPMNAAAYTLLSTNAQREAAVNAVIYDRLSGDRPEIIIPLAGENAPIPINLEQLKIGHRVRVLRAPHMGDIGTVNTIFPGLSLFPNGLRTEAAEIILEGEEKALVPLANIEVIG